MRTTVGYGRVWDRPLSGLAGLRALGLGMCPSPAPPPGPPGAAGGGEWGIGFCCEGPGGPRGERPVLRPRPQDW